MDSLRDKMTPSGAAGRPAIVLRIGMTPRSTPTTVATRSPTLLRISSVSIPSIGRSSV